MRVTGIRARNFKPLRDVEVSLNEPVVAIVGRNNSGKSALLDAIRLGRESFFHADVNPHPGLSRSGGWSEVPFAKQQGSDPVEIELRMDGTPSEFGLTLGQVPEPVPTKSACTLVTRLFPGRSEHHVFFNFDGQGTVDFKLSSPSTTTTQGQISLDASVLSWNLLSVSFLAADRRVESEIEAAGAADLADDGTNLMQVLNDRASRRPREFGAIVRTAQEIVPEIAEFLPGLQPQGNTVSGSLREAAFPDAELLWPNLSSGARQVMLLSTFLHTAPPSGLLLIEEPELYLHTESVWRLLDVFQEQAEEHGKQFIVTTHSPALVERLGLRSCVVAGRDHATGETQMESLAAYAPLDDLLSRNGFMAHELLLPSAGVKPLARFLLIVEGPDDKAIWPKLLAKAGVSLDDARIVRLQEGGWTEAAKAAALFKLLGVFGLPSVPALLVVEADEDADEKVSAFEEHGLQPEDFRILPLDIEGYLLSGAALATALNIPKERVSRAIRQAGGKPRKEKFARVADILGVKPNQQLKRKVASHLPRLHSDIREVIEVIRQRLPEPESGR